MSLYNIQCAVRRPRLTENEANKEDFVGKVKLKQGNNHEEINLIWDYFIIFTATSDRHNDAIVNSVIKISRKQGVKPNHVEVDGMGGWSLIDYNDVVVHVFSQEKRAFYKLEQF